MKFFWSVCTETKWNQEPTKAGGKEGAPGYNVLSNPINRASQEEDAPSDVCHAKHTVYTRIPNYIDVRIQGVHNIYQNLIDSLH